MTTTTLTIGRTDAGAPITVDVEHRFPLSAEWLARNRATVFGGDAA